MKNALIALSFLPLLAACDIETVDGRYFEPTLPRAEVRHHHERNTDNTYHRHEEARKSSSVVVRSEPIRRPRVRVEAPRNVHAHNPGPSVHVKPDVRVHKKPGVVVEGEGNNVHAHPEKPQAKVEVQSNVHGHE